MRRPHGHPGAPSGRRRHRHRLVAAVAITLLLAACSGDDDITIADPADEPASEPAAEPTEEPASEPAEEPAAEPVDEPAEEPAEEPIEEPAAEPTGALPDPCGLLTTEEVASATGLPFGDGVFNDALSSDRMHVCDWLSDDPFATAQVLLMRGDIGTEQDSIESAFGEDVIMLDLADASFRTTDGSLVAMQVGELFVQVAYIPPGPGEVADITVALAEQAVARL